MYRCALLTLFVLTSQASCRDTSVPSDPDARIVAPLIDAAFVPGIDAGPPGVHVEPTAAGIEYFSDISDGLTDSALVGALHTKLAGDHVELSFASLYSHYETTDGNRDGCNGIFDFYSSKCWAPEEACGNYMREGDCFNREHSWPKSWWGGGTGPDQHQDLIAVIPADGYVNNQRGQLPLGEVSGTTYNSTNGSRIGNCASLGIATSQRCFEPPNNLKGDMARIYFYMAVRYEGEFGCCSELSVEKSNLNQWQENQLRLWHNDDPVDVWERERNERVFGLQRNRNPFVDFPAYVDRISDF
ncbi:MAG: endonuclease [Kofleriaceae bacterium]|nr:endonuclease [Kofleriaceae bacterium]